MEKTDIIEKLDQIKSKILVKTNKSPVLLFFRILFAILLVDVIIILSFTFVDFVNIKETGFFNIYSFEENIFILALIFHLFFFLYLFIYWLFDYYIIGNGRVIHRSGILFKKKDLFIINEINSIEIYQNFFGRLFDYGNIILFYNEKEFILKNIPHPEEFVDFIELFKIK